MAETRKVAKPLVYNATLLRREDLTERLAIFRVQPDAPESAEGRPPVPEFEAGQYMVLGANNEDEPDKGPVRRAYSIASPPSERRWFEFYVRRVDEPASDNPFTHLLWKMREGSRLWVGPKVSGRFTLQHTIGEDDSRLKIFVASGAGLAPFVSIVMHYAANGGSPPSPAEQCVILHGASHPTDLGYKQDLERVLNDSRERYLPTISQPHLHPDWEGFTGRVETFFDAEKLPILEQRIGLPPGGLTPERCVVFVCGLKEAIAHTLVRLLERGFVPDDKRIRRALQLPEDAAPSLFFEQYDSEPILDLSNEEILARLRAVFPSGLQAPASDSGLSE